MDVNQRGVENVDEAWILKYRAALKSAPVEQPRLDKALEVMRALGAKIVSYMSQLLLATGMRKLAIAAKPVTAIPVGETDQGLKAS
jgi:hypothetical protein